MQKFIPALAALMLLAAPALAVEEVAQSAEEKAQTDWALSRGQLIYRLDRAAWVATDAIREKFKDAKELSGVRGWIVEPTIQGDAVIFYGRKGEVPFGLFVADVSAEKVTRTVKIAEAESALTSAQIRLVKAVDSARSAAGTGKYLRCAKEPFNSVVIPPVSPDAPVEVYLLTPQTKTDFLPFGGHHKVTVAVDGKVSARQFTNGCIEMGPLRGTSAVTITHLLDPTPTEVHTFTSLTGKTPVIVLTTSNKTVWSIENASITKMKLD